MSPRAILLAALCLAPAMASAHHSFAVYFDSSKGPEARSNYALREATLAAKKARPAGSTTAVSCCGANPGMVSRLWFTPVATGQWEIACSQLCGLGHYRMRGEYRIVTPEEWAAWQADEAARIR